MIQYLNDKDLYIFDGFAGANRKYQYDKAILHTSLGTVAAATDD